MPDQYFIATEIEIDIEFTKINNLRSLTHPGVLKLRDFGKTIALRDMNRPENSYYNRVVGFNEDDLDKIEEIVELYSASKLKCRISLLPDFQTRNVLQALERIGFKLKSTNSVYYHSLKGSDISQAENIKVEIVTEESIDILFALFELSGIKINPKVAVNVRPYYTAPHFRFYLAYINEEPVALASLYIYNNIGVLSNAYTVAEYRSLGCQTRLLQTRINEAKTLGCQALITDTELGSSSHRNILRSGFEMAYSTMEMEF